MKQKSLFFVIHLGYIFVKMKVAFVAESYTIVSQNFRIYFAAMRLDARLDAAAEPERMLANTGRGIVGQKLGALWAVIV